MWKTIFLCGLRISVCLGLSGFLFEDNKISKRWVKDNGEITYRLPQWYENIGYVQFVDDIINNETRGTLPGAPPFFTVDSPHSVSLSFN